MKLAKYFRRRLRTRRELRGDRRRLAFEPLETRRVFADVAIIDAMNAPATLNLVHTGGGQFSGTAVVGSMPPMVVPFMGVTDVQFTNLPAASLTLNFSGGDGVLDGMPNNTDIEAGIGSVRIAVNEAPLYSTPLQSLLSLTVTGTAAEPDSVTVDFTGAMSVAQVIPPGGINIVGDGQSDGFTVDQLGFNLATLQYLATGPGSGELVLDGRRIGFQGQNQFSADAASDEVAVAVATADDHSLSIAADQVPGRSMASFDGGLLPFRFQNPNVQLDLFGDPDNNDTIAIDSLDANFRAAISTDGQGGMDSIALNAPLNLGLVQTTGHVTFRAETIVLGASITTGLGNQGGNVTLDGTTTVAANNFLIDTRNPDLGGNVMFTSPVSSLGLELGIQAGSGNVTFDVAAGSFGDLAALRIGSADRVRLRDVTTFGDIAITGNEIQLRGMQYTAGGEVRFAGDVLLGTVVDGLPDVVSVRVAADAMNTAIDFGGKIDGAATLQLETPNGEIRVAGAIGNTTPLLGLQIVQDTGALFESQVLLDGPFVQTCSSGISAFASGLNTNGNPIAISASEIEFAGGDDSISGSSLEITGCGQSTLLLGDADDRILPILNFNADDIAALAGGFAQISFGDGFSPFGIITIDPDGAFFGDNVSFFFDTDLLVNGTLSTTADGDAADVRIFNVAGGPTPTVLSGDIVTAGGAVTIADSVLVDGIRLIDTTAGNTVPAGPVTIDHPMANISIDGFNSGGNDSLTIRAALNGVGGADDANVLIDGDVEGLPGAQSQMLGQDLESLTISGNRVEVRSIEVTGPLSLQGQQLVLNGATYTSRDEGILFEGPVTFTETMQTVEVTGGGFAGDNLFFNGSLDGAGRLKLVPGDADVIVNGLIGSMAVPAKIEIPSANNVMLGDVLVGRFEQTAGIGDTRFSSLAASGADGVSITNRRVLAEGSLVSEGEVRLTATLLIAISGGITNTGDAIIFDGPVQVIGDVVITSGADAGSIEFKNTLEGNGEEFTGSLTLTSGGDIDFLDTVGALLGLGNLIVAGANDVTFQQSLRTRSYQQQLGQLLTQFDGPVLAAGAGGLVVTGNHVTFNGPVTTGTIEPGPVRITNTGTLTIADTADMMLAAPQGAPGFLQNGTGPVLLGGDISTPGSDIVFTSPITLTGDVTLSTGAAVGGDIRLAAVDGGQRLKLEAGMGSVMLAGAVGAMDRLAKLEIKTSASVTANEIRAGSIVQVGGTGTTTLNGAVDTDGINGLSLGTAAIEIRAAVTSGDGPITLKTDSLTINGGGSLAGTSELTIAPRDPGTPIGVGSGGGTLQLDGDALARLRDGFSQIVIGDRAAGTGIVQVNSAGFIDPVVIAGGVLQVTGLNAGTNTATLEARTGGISSLVAGSGRDVEADFVVLKAAGPIGDREDPLGLRANVLDADSSAADGDQFYRSFFQTALGTIDAGAGTVHLVRAEFRVTDDSLIASSLRVEREGTLLGDGPIAAPLSVADGGLLIPGDSVLDASAGILQMTGLTLDDGANLLMELLGPIPGPNGYDQLQVDGNVQLGAAIPVLGHGPTLAVELSFTSSLATTFTILQNDGDQPISGEFVNAPDGSTLFSNGVPLEIDYQGGDGNDITLAFDRTPVIDMSQFTLDASVALVKLVGANLVVDLGGGIVLNTPLVNLLSLTILGGEFSDDAVSVEFADGSPLPVEGLFFDGRGQQNADTLMVVGGSGFAAVDYNTSGTGAGTLRLDGQPIAFAGLEPVIMAPPIELLTVTIDDANATPGEILTTEISDNGDPADGLLLFDLPAGLEDLIAAMPTVTLNLFGDGDDNDIFEFANLDGGFAASLNIDGGGGSDNVLLDAAMSLGSATSAGTITILSETINVGAAVASTTGGAVMLNTDSLAINAGGSLASAGPLTIAPQDPAASIGIGDNSGGQLQLDSAEIARLVDGFSAITIGDAAAGIGSVSIQPATFTDPLTVVGGDFLVAGLAISGPSNSATLIARTGSIMPGSETTAVTADAVRLVAADRIGNAEIAFEISAAAFSTDTSQGTGQFLSVAGSTLWNSSSAKGDITLVSGRFNVGGAQTISAIAVHVRLDATLGGTGTVAAPVDGDGTFAPGFSPGILNTGDFTFIDGANFEVELGGPLPGSSTTDHDQLNVTGGVTINPNVTLAAVPFGGYVPKPGDRFVIIRNDGMDPVTGEFANAPAGSLVTVNGVALVISYTGGDGNDVVLFPATTPSQPNLIAADDSGPSNSDNITNVTTPRFTGTSDPLVTVTLSSDLDDVLGMTTADAMGQWTFMVPLANPLSNGVHRITASVDTLESVPLVLAINTVAPVLESFTRFDPTTSPTSDNTLVFLATFNEDVANVSAGDFAVSGTSTATVTDVTMQTPSTFLVTVSGGDLADFNGIVGLNLAAGQNITNIAGNALPAGEPAIDETYLLDNIDPVLQSFTRSNPATSPTNANTLVFLATFSEAVLNVTPNDFTVSGTTTATVTAATMQTPSTFLITVSGGNLAGFNGTVGLNLAAGQNITDLAGKPLAAGEPAVDETYLIDNTAPMLQSFTRSNPATSPTNANTLIFLATFNEDVAGVDTADFAVAGTTTATVSAVAMLTPRTFNVTVSGGNLANFSGTVGLNLAAGQTITDTAGNALPASDPAVDESYLVDNTPPVLQSFTRSNPPTSPTSADVLVFLATFSEDVAGVDPSDFTVNSATTATVTAVTAQTPPRTFLVTVSGGDLAGFNGTVGLNLAVSQTISDLAGNALPAAEPAIDESYVVDNSMPVGDTLVTCTGNDLLTITDIVPGGKSDQLTITLDTPTGDFIISDTSIPPYRVVGNCGTNITVNRIRVPFAKNVRFDLLSGDDRVTVESLQPGPANALTSFTVGNSTGSDTVEFTGPVNLLGGSLSVDVEDVFVRGAVATAGGPLSLLAERRMEIRAGLSSGGGEITIQSRTRDIFMSGGPRIDAGAGDIHLTAKTGILLGELATTGDVILDGGNGGIADGNTTGVDIIAHFVQMAAGTAIGTKVIVQGTTLFDRLELESVGGLIESCARGQGSYLAVIGETQVTCPTAPHPAPPIDVVPLAIPAAALAAEGEIAGWRNPGDPRDVNNDWLVSPLDALILINDINLRGTRVLPHSAIAFPSPVSFFDVTGDHRTSAADVLPIVNFLNEKSQPNAAGGEGEADGDLAAAAVQFLVENVTRRVSEEPPLCRGLPTAALPGQIVGKSGDRATTVDRATTAAATTKPERSAPATSPADRDRWQPLEAILDEFAADVAACWDSIATAATA